MHSWLDFQNYLKSNFVIRFKNLIFAQKFLNNASADPIFRKNDFPKIREEFARRKNITPTNVVSPVFFKQKISNKKDLFSEVKISNPKSQNLKSNEQHL